MPFSQQITFPEGNVSTRKLLSLLCKTVLPPSTYSMSTVGYVVHILGTFRPVQNTHTISKFNEQIWKTTHSAN